MLRYNILRPVVRALLLAPVSMLWLLPAAADQADAPGALRFDLDQAVLLALENNPLFLMERLTPDMRRSHVHEARADFDPLLTAEITRTDVDGDTRTTRPEDMREELDRRDTRYQGRAGVEQRLPAGTRLALTAEASRARADFDPDAGPGHEDRADAARLELGVTQPLLRGFGPAANLVRLRQARIDVLISEYELRAAAEMLVERVEAAIWDYVLAGRRMEIYTESLRLAELQRDDVRERILVGHLADIELAAAEAEVAQRRENLINVRSIMAQRRLEILRLTGLAGSVDWDRPVEIAIEPEIPDAAPDPVERHVEHALAMRPELREAQLRIARGELEVAHTGNGLLPRLDFFITLGHSRYADSFGESGRKADRDENHLKAGLRFEWPPLNRAERARHRRANLHLQHSEIALHNLQSLVQVEVRAADLEVRRSYEQIDATRLTRLHREEALRAETEKFKVGKSTTMLVAQAQRDLVASRIAEVEAVASHLKARLALYRFDGSLLMRRGIDVAPVAFIPVKEPG